TNASLLGSAQMNNNLPVGQPNFALGNLGRTPTANFVGLIDEVRMSKIVRPDSGMIFAVSDVAIVTQPVDQTVAVSQSVTFSALATGLPPLRYRWRHGGVDIAGQTNTSLTIASAQLGDAGAYDVVAMNNFNAATSSVATLTVRVPLNLAWTG